MTRNALSHLAIALGLAATAACGASPPLGYQSGVRWTMPLVAPLDGAELMVPVTIHNKGPFLFVLSPDQVVSLIDRDVAQSLDLYTPADSWIGVRDETDHFVQRRPYEVLDMRSGELHLRNIRMYSAHSGSIKVRGVPVAGVIGADLLTRTIVIDVDRDRGQVQLVLTGHQAAPTRSTRIAGRLHRREGPLRKVVVPVSVDRERHSSKLELAVDLASETTQVWSKHIPPQSTPVRVGAQHIGDLKMQTFNDRRFNPKDIDGVLGQDVLSQYRVMLDQDKRILWLAPRESDLIASAAARIGRWGDVFSRCRALGCVTVRFDPIMGGQHRIHVERDPAAPGIPFDVVLQAQTDTGESLPGLVRIRVELSRTHPIMVGLGGARMNAATYRVVDASPQSATASSVSVSRIGAL